MAEDRRAAGHPPHCLFCSRHSPQDAGWGEARVGQEGKHSLSGVALWSTCPQPTWLRSANVVLWAVHVDSQQRSVSRPPDFGQSYLLSFKTELGGNEGWLGCIAVPKTGADDCGFHRSSDLTSMGTGGGWYFWVS